MKGYKVFEPDWKCRGFQYAVGKTFEEDVTPLCCHRGFHFCTELKDCFNYYPFHPNNKVAEVEALGEIDAKINTEVAESKYCTNKIKIVRELSWEEVLKMLNIGNANTGLGNTGDYNSGRYNSGSYNSGNCNSGCGNSGDDNSGCYNSGNYNSGSWNNGNCNSGRYNSGNWNNGNCNSGDYNSGSCNRGECNNGDCNSGVYNNGDYNNTNFSNGCFNTKSSKIFMFNKPSNWTIQDWHRSKARQLLSDVSYKVFLRVQPNNMTEEEKKQYLEHKITDEYLKELITSEYIFWWNRLSPHEKNIIKSLPNFDSKIFKEVTGIDINKS